MNPLSCRRRPVLGLFVSHLEGPYQQHFWRGFDTFCREFDCDLIVYSSRFFPNEQTGNERVREAVYRLADKSRIDGLCVDSSAFSSESSFLNFIAQASGLSHIPIIASSMDTPLFPSVVPDNEGGIRELVTHLVSEHHCKRICFAGGPAGVEDARKRLDSWRKAMDAFGLPHDSLCEYEGQFVFASGRDAVRYFLDVQSSMPDAIMFANDEMAFGGLYELKRRGIDVPQEILVTGFDNTFLSAFQKPSLTTAAQPVEAKAWRAGQLLLDAINGMVVPDRCTVPVRLIQRASCGCPADNGNMDFVLKYHKAISGMKQVTEGLGAVLTVSDLSRELNALMPSISGRGAFVSMYDQDQKYSLVIAATDGRGIQLVEPSLPRRFLSAQLVPDYLFDNDERKTLIVQALYRGEHDYGFLVCQDEGTESDVYVSLHYQVTAAISNILLVGEGERTEEKLREALRHVEESERRFREIADFVPAVIMESSGDGRLTYLNRAGCELFGLESFDSTVQYRLTDFVLEETHTDTQSGYVQLRIRNNMNIESFLLAKKSRPEGAGGKIRWHGMDFKPVLASMMMPDDRMLDGYDLSPREREILQLELEGYLGKEIADKLAISLSTVKGHVGSIYRKLGVGSRDQLFTLLQERIIGKWGYDSLMFSLLSRLLRE